LKLIQTRQAAEVVQPQEQNHERHTGSGHGFVADLFRGRGKGDTRVLVEDYFVRIPTERIARNAATPLETCGPPGPSRPAQKRRNRLESVLWDYGGARG
jgi:hypothetical protein